MSKGFLVCDNCGGFYELQENDAVRDFIRECQCGGRLRYKAKNPETIKNKDDNEEKIQIDVEDLINTLNSGLRNEKIKAAKQLAVIGDERALKPLYKVWFKNDIYAAKYAIEKIKEREKIDLDKKEVINLKKEIDNELTKKEEYEEIQREQFRSWAKTSGYKISDPGIDKKSFNFDRLFFKRILGVMIIVAMIIISVFIAALC